MKYHEPVLVNEVLEVFSHFKKQARIIDATLGTGGTIGELLKNGFTCLGIETDPEALEIARKRIESQGFTAKMIHGNFRDIDLLAKEAGLNQVDGVLFDLGVNLLQLTSGTRGMSFSNADAPFDMRLDTSTQGVTAANLVNALPEVELTKMFGEVMPANQSRKLSKKIVAARSTKPFATVGDFLEVSDKVLIKKGKTHSATKAFLALRIAVNSETEAIKVALPKALSILSPGGRLAVISFHSLEDGVVKRAFSGFVSGGQAIRITKKPIVPTQEEIEKNKRSRSAKLRVIEKIK